MDISLILDNGRPRPEARELAQVADDLAPTHHLRDHFMGHTDDAVSDEPMLECLTLLERSAAHHPGPARVDGPRRTYRHPAVVANQPADSRPRERRPRDRGPGGRPAGQRDAAYGIDLMDPHDLSDRFEESVAVIRRSCARTGPRSRAATSGSTTPPTTPGRCSAAADPGRRRRRAADHPDGREVRRRVAHLGHPGVRRPQERPARRGLRRDRTRPGRDPARARLPPPVGTDIAGALEPYRTVCDEFVVFDWFDWPLQTPSTT